MELWIAFSFGVCVGVVGLAAFWLFASDSGSARSSLSFYPGMTTGIDIVHSSPLHPKKRSATK